MTTPESESEEPVPLPQWTEIKGAIQNRNWKGTVR